MTKKRPPSLPDTVEDLFAFQRRRFERSILDELKHLIDIGAVVDSGRREADGTVRWTLNGSHPHWTGVYWEEVLAQEEIETANAH
jgi:hypothetical protein